MGSEQFERLGIGRSKEGALDYPEKFTVIGVDVDADKLIAKYKGTRGEQYAREVIGAVVQRYRTAVPPPAYFVASLTGGVNEPVILCDLGPDAKGKSWAVIVDGRQRVMGLRIVNDRNAASAPPMPRFKVAAVFRAFKHEGAGLAASIVKVASNVRVARTASQRADDARDLAERGIGHEDIAPLCEAKDAAEVGMLLALAGCCDEVKASVDAGHTPLAACVDLVKRRAEEQARRVARKTAGPSKAARDAAAPPRPRPRPAKVLESVEGELRRLSEGHGDDARTEAGKVRARDAAAVLAWARGGGEAPPWLAKAIDSAEATRKAAKGASDA